MSVTLHGIRGCDTVKKARAWLDARGVDHAFHDYKTAGADAAMLTGWADRVGWEPLLNRAGTTFRRLPDPDRAGIDRTKAIALMTAHPSLIRRPVVAYPGGLLVGFDPDVYADAFHSRP